MSAHVEFTGTARLDRRTKHLVQRLNAGDIAIIDHRDLDRVSAEELVESGVRVVVNVAESQSGRFPNPGPLLLVRGGVKLVDAPGAALFDEVSDGDRLTIRGGSVFRNGTCLATGRVLGTSDLDSALAAQKARVTEALEAFAENTMRYLREEGRLLSEGADFPPLRTRFRDRHALVVVRGPGMKRDLRMVRPYVRDFKPVLIAVDGGADALLEEGLKPDVIVGDMDSVSDRALQSGAEILVHAYRNGGAPGSARCEVLGIDHQVVSISGISEDVALLLAYEKGAELIVAVGTHFTLAEFLERDRAGMSSTFVTRLKVGEILIDAKGVSRLFSRRVGIWPLVLLAAAGLTAIIVALLLSDPLRHLIDIVGIRLRELLSYMPNVRASRELLASRDDVWAFVSDPFNLPSWWPRVAGVQPDRRGLAPGARWHVQGTPTPTLFRRPEAVGQLLVRDVEAPERLEFHLTGDRLDVELLLEEVGPARTRASVRIEGPWLVGLSRSLPRQVLGRLYALLQTGAA